MNADELEREIRATLNENVQHIDASALDQSGFASVVYGNGAVQRRWLVPALAAAAVVVMVGIIGAALAASGTHPNRNPPMSTTGFLGGSWELASATARGRHLKLPSTQVVTMTFLDADSIVIDNGVNTIILSGHGEDGSLRARFRSTTYVLDPRSSDAEGRMLLDLVDSIAPDSDPGEIARSSYTIVKDQLSIRTAVGELVFTRLAAVPGEPRRGSPGTSPTTAQARSS